MAGGAGAGDSTAGARGGAGVGLRMGQPVGRWTLFAAILGSSLALLDSTVVNVALPRLGEELGATVAGLQWTVNGYTLTLAALILLGGSLGDRYGRRRVFVIGAAWFAVASLLCGVSPSITTLIGARLLQGIGAALLTPGSLALIQASFHPDDRGRAVGAWSGLTGVAAAIGPLLGGWLVDAAGWRWVFFINPPLAVLVIVVASRHVPESTAPDPSGRFDMAGAVLAVGGLAGVTYALITTPTKMSPSVLIAGAAGILALVAFVPVERRVKNPMVSLGLFSSRQFSAVNGVTVWVYAANGLLFFFVVLQLQVVAGYSPVIAGLSLLPVTLALLGLSSRAGDLSQRIGARLPMTVGTATCAVGALLLAHIGTVSSYPRSVLPGAVLFGVGLGFTVAPLTAAVLAAVDTGHAGVASGVNNAVARAAGLLSLAVVPAAVGLTGAAYRDPVLLNHGFRLAMYACAGLMAIGAALSWTTVSARPCARPASRFSCPVASPHLEPNQDPSAPGTPR
ncbi:MAG TPA: MFS transporter [Mycobacteriales bacterium]